MKTATKPNNMFQGMKVAGAPASTPTGQPGKPAFGKFGGGASSDQVSAGLGLQETPKQAPAGPMFNKFSQPEASKPAPVNLQLSPKEGGFAKFGGAAAVQNPMAQSAGPTGFSRFGGGGFGANIDSGLNSVSGNVNLSGSISNITGDDSPRSTAKSEVFYMGKEHQMDDDVNSTAMSEVPQSFSKGAPLFGAMDSGLNFAKRFGNLPPPQNEEEVDPPRKKSEREEPREEEAEDEEPSGYMTIERELPQREERKPVFEKVREAPVSIQDKIFSKAAVTSLNIS
jgi:hypothetical protein